MKKTTLFHSLMLLMCSVIWGTSFVWQSESVGFIGPLTFTALRFLIGAAIILPVVLIIRKYKKRKTPLPLKGGAICGIALTAAACLQQIGIQTVPPGKAGFMTAMYIVIVPLLSIFSGKKPKLNVLLAALLAAAGLYMLCIGEGTFAVSSGDLLLIASAFLFAVQILFIDKYIADCDGLELSLIQFAVCGLSSMVFAIIFEAPTAEQISSGISPLLKSGILSCGIAYSLQTVGQKGLDPTVASLLMSGESVFAVIAGWLLLGSSLSAAELAGCVTMFCAVVLSQLTFKKSKQGR